MFGIVFEEFKSYFSIQKGRLKKKKKTHLIKKMLFRVQKAKNGRKALLTKT
jgi:hypothetical protein